MKTQDILARVASGQLTSEQGAELMAARNKRRKLTQPSMSLQELCDLLEGMEGKNVRGARVSSASVAVDVRANGFSVVVEHAVPGKLLGETVQEMFYRVILGKSYAACVCSTEDELRAVLLDPAKGDWYVDDELRS